MDGPAAHCLRIGESCLDPFVELALAAGQARQAPLAAGPVPRRHVEERLRQAVTLELLSDGVLRMIVGEKELDAGKASSRGPSETLQERHLLKHHAEIGGEPGHGGDPELERARGWR